MVDAKDRVGHRQHPADQSFLAFVRFELWYDGIVHFLHKVSNIPD